jgi:hypothetical protein
MPDFDSATIESWYQERVTESKLTKEPLSDWQVETLLRVCEEDLQEEERRLQCALNDVRISRSNIRSLKKKRENILRRMNETR